MREKVYVTKKNFISILVVFFKYINRPKVNSDIKRVKDLVTKEVWY